MQASKRASNPPTLFVKSVNLPLPADFKITDALRQHGSAFIRAGEGMVTEGSALTLESGGPNRIAQLNALWAEVSRAALISEITPNNGRGLVGFGAIAFDDHSECPSVIRVPERILCVRDGRASLTVIGTEDFPLEPVVDSSWTQDWVEAWPRQSSVHLAPGLQDEAGFEQSVERALTKLETGGLEKVVLSRDISAEVGHGWDPRETIARLAKRYPSCWTYWVGNRFGASPELLVRVDHKRFSARVLAGTAGRGTDPDVDRAISSALMGSPKNRQEHRLAVESLTRALAPFCTEIQADSQPFSLALPNVWHLASDVQGILSNDSSVLAVAEALHPTAAVAGTPREVALALIRELEPFDRGTYAGPVGWIGADGDGEWVIALRGAVIEGNRLVAHAGCGIVRGSSPEAELAETQLKFEPMRQALS